MSDAAIATPLFCPLDPLDVLRRWPADRPIAMLHSGRFHPERARWSVIAQPQAIFRFDEAGPHLDSIDDQPLPASLPAADQVDNSPLTALDQLLHASRPLHARPSHHPGNAAPVPVRAGGWIGSFNYELGRCIEPAARYQDPPVDDRNWPLIELLWCPDVLVFDHQTAQWSAVGENIERPASWIDDLTAETTRESDELHVEPPTHTTDPDQHMASVARVLEYVAAGDIFQANLTHRLTAEITGSTRRLAATALSISQPWYGAYIELPRGSSAVNPSHGRAVLSLSPELFLHVDAETRDVTTRPIKGTRPASTSADELAHSEKDAAELNMIIDLMRNDLGRVCEFGSVLVPHGRVIETHPTVHHGVGEVVGRLRDGVSIGELLSATFPAGSITGAPKIRAMQIIEELETVRRGPYCGAIGWIGRNGEAALNVAIRTLAMTGARPAGRWDRLDGVLDYGVGGGIVADSDPAAEYRETLDKAAVLRQTLTSCEAGDTASRTPAVRQ